MSTATFSRYQVSILPCGPNSTPKHLHLKCDIRTFFLKLRPTIFFENTSKKENDILYKPLVQKNSKFYIPKNKNKELDHHINYLIICILLTLTNLFVLSGFSLTNIHNLQDCRRMWEAVSITFKRINSRIMYTLILKKLTMEAQ